MAFQVMGNEAFESITSGSNRFIGRVTVAIRRLERGSNHLSIRLYTPPILDFGTFLTIALVELEARQRVELTPSLSRLG